MSRDVSLLQVSAGYQWVGPEREPWMDDALCTQVDPEAFFPPKGGSNRDAKKLCAECPVRAECLAYALENDERFGIWGGLSPRDRRRLQRKQHGAA